MPAKAVAKKTPATRQASAPPEPAAAAPQKSNQASPSAAPPQQKTQPKKAAAPKKKAAVATAPENRAHHATLSETQCSDCAVGLLKQFSSESLRHQKKVDPSNQRLHLGDDEELEFIRTNPLTLQLVGLRRERSLSNRFDDLLVVLYSPPLLKEGEKTVLDAEGLRAENLESAQAYVGAILGEKSPAPPTNWPAPGVDVSCKQCKHWRVLVAPITTEPGYDKKKPKARDARGKPLPDFDNLTLLPSGVAAVTPGIYNASYRVGVHKGSVNPPTSYAALQLATRSIPARRRYPISDFLTAAEAAYKRDSDGEIRKALIKEDAKAQQEARTRLEQELGKTMPKKTAAETKALQQAVQARLNAENLKVYAPRIAERRKSRARAVLAALKAKLESQQRLVCLENASGAETRNLEMEGNRVSHIEVVDDDHASMKVAIQLVPTPSRQAPIPPPHQPPPFMNFYPLDEALGLPPLLPPAPPSPPGPLKLTKDDILVTLGTAMGTNMHRSVDEESVAWKRNREVDNWSEGCQVFRSPSDFRDFLRMTMLSKRALCTSRTARCAEKLTVEDVEKGIGATMMKYIQQCPKEFAKDAKEALTLAFAPPATPATPAIPKPATSTEIEKLLNESKTYKTFDTAIHDTFERTFPAKGYADDETLKLMKRHTYLKVIAALNEKSSEDDISKTIKTGIIDFRNKLVKTKEGWIKGLHSRELKRKHQEFLDEGLEPCDFGLCTFNFDYVMAETTRANMEAFVVQLGDRGWNSLFPEDVPLRPPSQPTSKSTPIENTAPAPAQSTVATKK